MCEETAAKITKLGGQCYSLPMDISSETGCKALAQALAAKEKTLDVLVNNAGGK